ncbi:ABC transporter permease [Hansschlegelia sp.]|uniref:ABC transporter permease n=1 Tax=Hansschlegelia sp. TaxID=2041892 RepID=UPI002B7FDDEF|nr:ABC transporter permease [Hansschlegelia sp.]HVI28482.1 ABC transporter permease [Hansschlegelia sp.]
MNIAASASLQLRTIFALMLRRMRTKYANSRAGYIWAIVEPLIWIFVLKFAIRGRNDHHPPVGTSYEVFFAGGVLIARTWRTVSQSTSKVLRRSQGSLPAVQRIDAAYATWLLEMATAAVAMLVVLASLEVFGFDAVPYDPLTCLAAFGATAAYTLAFSLVLALAMTVAPGLGHFQHILMLCLFMTSGFTTIVDRVPPQLREILVWNPVVHCVEWFREGFYRGYVCASLDREYLFTVTLVCLLIGLAGERVLRRHRVRRR